MPPAASQLRVGVAQLSTTNPLFGIRQLGGLLSVEGLGRPTENGQMQPWLAESWVSANGQRTVPVKLRSNVRFNDGSPFDAGTAAALLPGVLHAFMGPAFSDFDYATAIGTNTVEIAFKHPAPFLLEALEATIDKGGASKVGTGAYVVSEDSSELRVNESYYQGRPKIARISVANYPSVRAAWADLLRDKIDMLYEVGPEAFASLEGSSKVSVFTVTRYYQHVLVLNTRAGPLRSTQARRALNFGIDRKAVVAGALNGHGIESSGPLPTGHWALSGKAPLFLFDPTRAVQMLAASHTSLRFKCLVASDALDERIALELKRQLGAIGVDMGLEEAPREEILRRAANRDYEALLTELLSGPTFFRPYLIWHSDSPVNWGHFGSDVIDAALDRARNAPSEDRYRAAIDGVQRAFAEDPPAVFLAWSVRARAISRRFEVPRGEPGRDILASLPLWRPAGEQRASDN